MLEEAEKVRRGEEPKGLVRDPAQNECIMLPTADLHQLREARPLAEMLRDRESGAGSRAPREFAFFAHQPESIRQEYRRAMGLDRVELTATR
jgi:5,5'-dehydrodivanillate O-demethylase